MTLKNTYKQWRATKILFLMFGITLFCIGTASAFEFDNKLTYSNKDMKVSIDNLFGLGKHFGDIELKSHSSVTEIKKVGFGKEEVVMYYDFSGWELYENGLGEVIFTDMRTGKKIEKDYYFVEWKEVDVTVNDYKDVFSHIAEYDGEEKYKRIKVGKHIEKRFKWVRYDSKDIPNKNIRIGLKTYVGRNDYIDGVWTIAGKKVSKHITWAGDIQPSIIFYTKAEDESGVIKDETDSFNGTETNIVHVNSTSGKIGQGAVWGNSTDIMNISAIDFNFSNSDWTISGWMKADVATLHSGFFTNTLTGDEEGFRLGIVNGAVKLQIGSTEIYDGDVVDDSIWRMWTATYDVSETNFTFYLNNTQKFTISSYSYFGKGGVPAINYLGIWSVLAQNLRGVIDEVLIANEFYSQAEISYLYNDGAGRVYGGDDPIPPVVTLETPNNDTSFTATNEVDFECYVYDYTNALMNVSLYIDDVLNETVNNPSNATSEWFNKILSEGEHWWTCEVYSNISESFTAGKFLLDVNTTPNIVYGEGVYPDYSNITNDFFNVNVTLTETFFKNVTFDLYNANGGLNQTETFTDATRSKNWTNLPDATYSYNVTIATTTNQFNHTATRNISVDANVASVSVFYPTPNIEFQELNTNLSLNWSANDTNLDTCIYNYNTTNITVTCSDNQTGMNITDSDYTNVSFWVNDSFGNIIYTFISWEYRLFEINQTFTASVTEGYASTFTLNILTNGTDITLANLSYDNGQNIGTITESPANSFTITKSIVAPSVTTNTNKSFFWNISQNGGFYYALAKQNQTVTNIGIDNCSTNTIVLYNFTIVDEATQVKLSGADDNTTGRVNLQLMSLDRVNFLTNYSTFFNKTNSFYVCLNATFGASEKFVVDVQVEYDADNYDKELYHIQNETLNQTTINMNKTLYDLLSADSQEFKLIVKDASYLALADALIEVQRKYVDEGVFKVVEIPKTDEKGETIAHLVVNDAIYNFVIKKYGTTIKTINNVIPVCQTPLVTTCKIDFNAFTTSIEVPDYEVGVDFNYTLGYDSTTKVVSSVFNIPSGTPATIVLSVIVDDELGTSVCTNTLTTNTGTLSCIVPNSFGNATVLAKLTKDDLEVARGNIKLDQDPSDIYGTSLIFLGLFAMLTLIGASVTDNPVYTLVFFMLGVILLFSLNLVANNGFIGGTATILWLIIAIVIVIIKGARRN